MSAAAFETSMKAVITALEAHEKFPEHQQARAGKIYFMWDFVGNTLRMFQGNPDKATKRNVFQRCMFANILFNDDTGKLTLLCGGDQTDFGSTIKERGEECQRVGEEWAVAENVLND